MNINWDVISKIADSLGIISAFVAFFTYFMAKKARNAAREARNLIQHSNFIEELKKCNALIQQLRTHVESTDWKLSKYISKEFDSKISYLIARWPDKFLNEKLIEVQRNVIFVILDNYQTDQSISNQDIVALRESVNKLLRSINQTIAKNELENECKEKI